VSFKNYELDIVALDPRFNEIVFIEVKTRQTEFFGLPSNAVNYLKLRSLNRAAKAYLRAQGLHNLYRFDIISVTPGKMEHFENVTWP
jgi:putative endonuclease